MILRTLRRVAIATLAAAFGAAQVAEACTSFVIKATDGSPVYGRTMEFGFEVDSKVIVIPRNHAYVATGAGNRPGLKWTTRYGAVGVNGFDKPFVLDGMNEKGLAGGILYFSGFAGYADAATADPARAMAPWEFLTWALTNFATVAEVKAALDQIEIIDLPAPQLGLTPPVHYTLHDLTGASLVIEPIGGKLKTYENPLGVLTNSPTFDWHLTNLGNYVKISPVEAEPLKIEGVSIPPLGQGSGLLGIPGDPTPPSRFVRVLGYAASAKKLPTAAETVKLAEHVLNNFDIPVGFVRPPSGGKAHFDYTQWSAISDLAGKRYHVKTYGNQILRSIDLMSFDLDAKTIRSAPLAVLEGVPKLEFPKDGTVGQTSP